MKFKSLISFIVYIALLANTQQVDGQALNLPSGYPTYEISENNSPEDQYLFLGTRPTQVKYPAYLVVIDNFGTPVYYRYLPLASGGFSPESNNRMSFWSTSSTGNRFYVIDSYGNLADSISMENYKLDNHDFIVMGNGHFLIFGLDTRIIDMSLIVSGGKTAASVSGCVIQELDENRNVVFEWNSWDHFEITDSYENLTKSSIDLVHPNSIEIDKDGNILLIGRTMDEITKISRATGNIIWRMGGKKNQFTFTNPVDTFSWPHDFRQISDNHYTLFDNGKNRVPAYSRAIEYSIDEINKTVEKAWEYDADKEVYSPSGGSARRLPSGNTILGFGGQVSSPAVIEVHPDGSKAFQLNFTGDFSSGRAVRSDWKTSLFEPSVDEIDFGDWDGYTGNAVYLLSVKNNSTKPITLSSYSTRTSGFYIDKTFPVEIPAKGQTTLPVIYYPVNIKTGYIQDVLTLNSDINSDTLVQRIACQVKLTGTQADAEPPEATFSVAGETDVPQDTVIYITFNEPVRWTNNTEFTYSDIDQLVVLKKGDSNGEDVPFDAVISTNKDKITIRPEGLLDHSQTYYIAFSGGYEDYSNNSGVLKETTFATIDLTAPLVTITPADGATDIFLALPVTIQYDEPVRHLDNSELSSTDLASLITYKVNDENGPDVSYSATINPEKTIISITPDEYMDPFSLYFVAIGYTVEDYSDNKSDSISTTFTTGNATAISPASTQKEINVYPNPGNGLFRLQIPEQESARIRVSDLNGRVVYDNSISGVSSHLIDLKYYPDGMYILKVEIDGHPVGYIFKLVKQNE